MVAVSVLAMAGIVAVASADNSGRFDANLTGFEEISDIVDGG